MSEQAEEPEVTIVFRGRDRTKRYARSPWVSGKRLKDYLKSPIFREHGLLLLALKSRILDQDARKLRLTYPLNAGDRIYLIPQGRTEV